MLTNALRVSCAYAEYALRTLDILCIRSVCARTTFNALEDLKADDSTCVDPHISADDWTKHFSSLNGIKKVQVGKDQEKAQSEKDSHSKNQGGKKPN